MGHVVVLFLALIVNNISAQRISVEVVVTGLFTEQPS